MIYHTHDHSLLQSPRPTRFLVCNKSTLLPTPSTYITIHPYTHQSPNHPKLLFNTTNPSSPPLFFSFHPPDSLILVPFLNQSLGLANPTLKYPIVSPRPKNAPCRPFTNNNRHQPSKSRFPSRKRIAISKNFFSKNISTNTLRYGR